MDPFNFNYENNFQNNEDFCEIIIWLEKRGRKSNTYMTGWNLSKNDLKEHLKNLKKKFGCNGSIKNKKKNNNTILLFHLQGDWQNKLEKYLISQGINNNNIRRKG